VVSLSSYGPKDLDVLGSQAVGFYLSSAVPVGESRRFLVEVDYSAFAGQFGGDWAQRLELRSWVCTPQEVSVAKPGGCGAGVVIASVNDVSRGVLSAEITVDSVKLTGGVGSSWRLAGPSGSSLGLSSAAGQFSATSLSATGKWSSDGNQGRGRGPATRAQFGDGLMPETIFGSGIR
jgi:hypothetical protein